VIRLADLSRRESLPLRFLEQILRDLTIAGILKSKRGKGGGYELNRSTHQITMGEVIRRLDGPLAPYWCVTNMDHCQPPCPRESTCGLRNVMQEIRTHIVGILDQMTLAEVCERSQRLEANRGTACLS
jgi:Rrf2 family protein